MQVKQALDDGVLDAENLVSGKSFADQLKDNSLTELAKRFGFNVEFEEEATSLSTDEDGMQNVNGVTFEELFSEVSTRSEDLLFALKFVEIGSTQEAALLANIDKLDSIMYLSHKFQGQQKRLDAIYNNLDVVDSLNQLVFELSVFPRRLDIVFEKADLAPSILSAYLEYENSRNYAAIDRMFESSAVLVETLSEDGENKLASAHPAFEKEIEANSHRAAEISALIDLVGADRASLVLSNLDQFNSVQALVFRTKQDSKTGFLIFIN